MEAEEGNKIKATFTFIGNYGNPITKQIEGFVVRHKKRLRVKENDGNIIRLDKLDKGSIVIKPQ
jgi:hypothetical protein